MHLFISTSNPINKCFFAENCLSGVPLVWLVSHNMKDYIDNTVEITKLNIKFTKWMLLCRSVGNT